MAFYDFDDNADYDAFSARQDRIYDAAFGEPRRRGRTSNCGARHRGDLACGADDCVTCYPGTMGICPDCHGLVGSECTCD